MVITWPLLRGKLGERATETYTRTNPTGRLSTVTGFVMDAVDELTTVPSVSG